MADRSICTISGCEKKQFAAKWCAGHYHRWRKHGDPLGGRWPVVGCAIAGCVSQHKAKGFCGDHYDAFRRHGDPLAKTQGVAPGALLSWLKENASIQSDECLEWPFSRYRNGYGHVSYGGVETTAHRAMCFLAHGDPSGADMEAAHSCHNRACCNPKHLRWASHQENMADKASAGSQPIGEVNGAAVVSEAAVREIRRMRGAISQKALASRYGITKSNVSAIQLRKSWRHVM